VHSPQIFFALRSRRRWRHRVRKNFSRDIAVASNFLAVTKIVTAQKPLIHRHFCTAPVFAQDIARAKKFLPRRCAGDAVAHCLRMPFGAVTHKI
jgi:hypothetical protein